VAGASEAVATGDLLESDHSVLLAGCDAVINCAARVHIMKRELPASSGHAYHLMNAEFPLQIANAAKAAGAKRFVQLSSVAAIASDCGPDEVLTDETSPRPTSLYGRSKLAADHGLQALASPDFTVASLRPPAIFGPGVGAWFAMFDRAASAGLPLPLSAIRNRRSFAFSGNIADAVTAALRRPHSGAWLVTDSEPLSTADLYDRLSALHGHGRRTFPLPEALVRAAAKLALRGRADSLLGNAAFDGARFAVDFQWQPQTPLDKALALTVGACRA
jgi:UDP-glucose 4-epimerase